ncbi:DUF2919 family protein [Salinimonas chungwhensis]|uniref:DUF2919 family protein n=1 Tax=Salinimonas chungwhensis TaxID=265425 RepID=UPI00037B59D4|nr:DUF2919 family protein [Salinimonas chungwhensis]
MAALPLPLHCYDDAGIIKPPRWLYWLLLINSVDWTFFIFSVASRQHTSQLLGLFFPDRSLLWYKLAVTLPFIITALLLGNRQRLWKKSLINWYRLIPWLTVGGVAGSLTVVLLQLAGTHWYFQPVMAGQICALFTLATLMFKSKHVALMLQDWKK